MKVLGSGTSRITVWLLGLTALGSAASASGSATLATQEAAQPAATRPAEQTQPLEVTARLVDRPDEVLAVLSNGLRIIVKQFKVGPVVSVRMYVKTGSIYEQEHLGAGLSHLFEHLLHGGTTLRRSEKESQRLLQQIGGQSNAYTSYDHTCYYINTASKYLPQAIDLLADWITRPAFPDSEFQRELGVVQRELERHADDPIRQLHYLTMQTMYLVHPARFPVIGYKAAIESLTKQDVVAYWRRNYVPDNVVVSICGDVDLEGALRLVREAFGDFRRRPVRTPTIPAEPDLVAPRLAVKRMGINAALLRLAWPSIPLTHPDLYALDVASFILTAGPSARLTNELVYRKRLATSVSGFSWTPAWGRGIFAVTARCPAENLSAVRRIILEQAERLRKQPVSEAELAKAKRQKVAEHVQSAQRVDEIAGMLATDLLATGDPHFSADYVEKIQQVTAADIQRVAGKYLQPEKLATILILPTEARLPDWAQTAQAKPTGQPSPIRKLTLANGLRVLLQSNPATPTVSIQLYCLGGVLAENEQVNGISNLMAKASIRGTKSRTGGQIAEFFDSIGGSIEGGAGSNTLYYRAEVLSENVREALEVFADVVLHPSFAEQAVEEVRKPILDQIRRLEENWRSELFAYLRSKYFGDHPYGLQPIGRIESVSRLLPQDLAEFHRRYVVASNAVLAVFGDIDIDEVEEQIRKLFAEMPAGQSPPLAPAFAASPAKGKVFVKAKPPERQVAGLAVAFGSVPYTALKNRFAMTVLDTILSGYTYPAGWLHEALRGGTNKFVYEVHAINWTALRGGFLPIYAGCQPDQINRVISIILESIDKARAGSFDPDEFQTAKGVILTTDLLETQTNAARAIQSALDEIYGLGYDFSSMLPEVIDKIQMDDVKHAASQYLQQPVIVVVTPRPDLVRVAGFETVVEPPAQTQPVPETLPSRETVP